MLEAQKKIKSDHPDFPQSAVSSSMDMEVSRPSEVILEETLESQMVDQVIDNEGLKEREETTHTLNSSPPENAKSFQDAVLNQRSANQKEIDKRIAEFDISDDEEDEMESEEAFPTKSRIKINFPKEKLKRIRQQYRGCLIIKLLGKNIGYKIFMDKISRLWSLEGLFVPIDLGLGFYLIRFETKADYTKVYTGGPWIIQDHYLTVRKWHNDYRADKATAIPTPVWMSFPLLPLEYYDEDIIMEIAGSLGKPIRVDNKTEASIRASFARVCVEIDLSQPLEPSVAIGKYDYSIEYEHIHLICFSCGRVGHRKENCSSSSESEKREEASNLTVNTTGAPDAKSVCYNGLLQSDDPTEIGLGEWMMVTRRNRRQPRALGPKNPEAQPNARHASSSNKAQSNTKPQAHKAHAPSPTTQSQPSISNPLQLQNRYQPVQQQTSIHNEVDQGLNPLASTPISPRSSGPAQKTSNSAHPNAKANLAQSRKGKGAISQQKNTPQPPKKNPNPMHISPSPTYSTLPPNQNPPQHPSSSTSASLPPHIKPPDPNFTTYHEFARNREASHQSPDGENPSRPRERSRSPGRNCVVDERSKPRDPSQQEECGRRQDTHARSESVEDGTTEPCGDQPHSG